MSITPEKRLLEAARRCDGAAIEVIAKAGRTNLDAVDQVRRCKTEFVGHKMLIHASIETYTGSLVKRYNGALRGLG